MNYYKIPEETLPELSPEDRLGDIEEVIKILTDSGISVSNTRIQRYYNFLKAELKDKSILAKSFFPNSQHGPFKSNSDWILYITREVHELLWIVKGLKEQKPQGLEERLKEIVSGADFAALDKNSNSRDLQYELRIASYFCQEGWEVDLTKLTDVIVKAPKFNLYMECKRVTNQKKLIKRLKEAKDQINQRMPKSIGSKPCYSMICVDVTKVAFEHNGLVWGLTPDHTKDIIQQKLIEIAQRINIDEFLDGTRNILSIWLQIHIPTLVKHPQTIFSRFSNYEILNHKLSRKAEKTLKKIIKVKETVTEEPRNKPPEKLEIQNNVTLPKGTTWSYEDGILEDFLRGNFNFDPYSEEPLLHVKLNETEIKFVSFDFYLIQSQISNEERKKFQEDEGEAMIGIMCKLIASKFPYGVNNN